jgi:hypothetical protein
MEKLPKGYFFKNGVPTIENIRAWCAYFDAGGTKDDKKIHTDAFDHVRKVMGWKSLTNGLVCFIWGLDLNAQNSKRTGDYAKLMVETKNLAWDIREHFDSISHIEGFYNDYVYTNNFNCRLYETGDIRYFYLKYDGSELPKLYFNYGKYFGHCIQDIIQEDIHYMMTVVSLKSEISNWVKAYLWEFIIPELNRKKEKLLTLDKTA